MKKFLLCLLTAMLLVSMTGIAVFAAEDEEESGPTWVQWHKSTGVSEIDPETGVTTFTNTVNGDTSFARSDMKFGMNGFHVKLKYGFQDKTGATPDALVAPPALNKDTVESDYHMGFRIQLSSRYELNDSDPQLCLRFMPFDNGESTNFATVNFWVSVGKSYDAGAWIFTQSLLAPFYWDESASNDISLARKIDGKFYLTVNGESEPIHEAVGTGEDTKYVPYRNLDTALSKFDNGEGYFIFWNNYSTADAPKYASKLTVEEMGSTLPELFTESTPFGYAFEEEGVTQADWGYDASGKLQLKSKGTGDFTLTETDSTRSLSGTGTKFYLKKTGVAGEYFNYNFIGADGAFAKLKFTPTAADKADLALEIGNGTDAATTKTVSSVAFNWHGETAADAAYNSVTLFREKADFIVEVNGVRIDNTAAGLNTARLREVMTALENSNLQYENGGTAEMKFDGFVTKLPASTPKGWKEGTEGETGWDSDFDNNPIIWSEDGVFSAVNTATPALVDSFGVKVLIDKKDTAQNLNFILSAKQDYYKKATGGSSVIISLKSADQATTAVTLSVYDQETKETTVVTTGTLSSMNWTEKQEVPVQFGIANGVWQLYVRNSKVVLDNAKIKTAMDAVLEDFDGKIAYLQISNDGGEGSAVTFLDMLHYLPGPAVIDGILSNSNFPTYGAPQKAGDIVMTFSDSKGETIRVMNQQIPVDGFSVEFDMFATPKAGMGHIVIAIAMRNTWHSLDTGIQLAITSCKTQPLSTEKANVGLTMTDAELGLSNSPLVTYDVPFNWRGKNTLTLDKVDGQWLLKVNGKAFNEVKGKIVEELTAPVKKDDTVVAETVTEILDVISQRFNKGYGYLQMWNNFGSFTMGMTDSSMVAINVPPAVNPGIKRDFTAPVNQKIRLDLNKFFTDSDGTIERFTVDGGATVVDGHILEFTLTSAEKKYINIRAYDNRDEFGLVRVSVSEGAYDIGDMGVDGDEPPATDGPDANDGGGCGCGMIFLGGAGGGLTGLCVLLAAVCIAWIPMKKRLNRR